jgi:hypothetical protein
VVLCCWGDHVFIGGGGDGGGGPGGRCEPEFESYGDADTVYYAVCVCVFVCDAKPYREWYRDWNSVTQSYGLRHGYKNRYRDWYRHRDTYRKRYSLQDILPNIVTDFCAYYTRGLYGYTTGGHDDFGNHCD